MNEKIPVQTIEEILTKWRDPPKRVLFVVREESDLKSNALNPWREYFFKKQGFVNEEEVRTEALISYLRLRSGLPSPGGVYIQGYDRVVAYRELYEQFQERLSSSGVSVVRSNLTSFFKATEILHHTEPSTSVWESNEPTSLENTLFGTTSRASVKDYIVRKFQENFDTVLYLGGGCFCCSAVYDSEATLDLFQDIFGDRIIVASSSKNFEGRDGKADSYEYNKYLNLGRGYGKKIKYLPTLIGI